MFTREITDAFFENALKVDIVIPVALSCHDYEALPDAFEEDFAEWLFDVPSDSDLLNQLPGIEQFLGGGEASDIEVAAEVAEWLYDNNFDGFLAQISTPVRTYRADGSAHMGWHLSQYSWVYGDTMEQVAERALAWIARRIEVWKAKGGRHAN